MMKAGHRNKVVCFTGWGSLPHITCDACVHCLKHSVAYPGMHRDAVLVAKMRKEAKNPEMTRDEAIIRSCRFDPLAALSHLVQLQAQVPS